MEAELAADVVVPGAMAAPLTEIRVVAVVPCPPSQRQAGQATVERIDVAGAVAHRTRLNDEAVALRAHVVDDDDRVVEQGSCSGEKNIARRAVVAVPAPEQTLPELRRVGGRHSPVDVESLAEFGDELHDGIVRIDDTERDQDVNDSLV